MTLGNLLTKTDSYLGASNIYKSDRKTLALNEARKRLLAENDIPEAIRVASVPFTLGIGALPTDHMRTLRMFDPTTQEWWNRIDENSFDRKMAKTFTMKWNATTSLMGLYIFPLETRTLSLRYVTLPTDMSTDADVSGLSSVWDEPLACLAASIVLSKDRQAEATNKRYEAEALVKVAIRNQFGDQREAIGLQSIYDSDYSLLGEENG